MNEENGVIHVTGLTPDQPPSETTTPVADDQQQPSPAAPPVDETVAAQLGEQPADSDAIDGDEPTDDQTPAAHKGKPSRGVQKRLDYLTERATSAERNAAQLAEALRIVNATRQQQPQQPQPQPEPDTGPKAEQYAKWEEFQEARSAWVAQRAARQESQGQMMQFVGSLLQANKQQAEASRQQALNNRIVESTAKAADAVPDWQDVLDCDLVVPPVLHEAIARSDDPAMALHYLAKHPEQHRRLMQIQSPTELAFEAGRLFSGGKAPSVVSKAPPPGKPVGARTTAPSGYRDDFTPAQHRAWYEKNVAKG
jgi:hypothetical protein